MKLKKVILILAAATLPAVSNAGVMFNASFLEQWFTVEGGFSGAGPNVDAAPDLLTFNLSQSDTETYNLQVTNTKVTFDSGILRDDTFDGGLGFNTFGVSSGITSRSFFNSQPSDSFSAAYGGFDVGDSSTWVLDVDDGNAVVRGTNGGAGNQNFAGSVVEVSYLTQGMSRTASFTFGACNPASPDDCSAAGGALEAYVPNPASLALFAIGLLGLGFTARHRKS